jgi:hypothetical protein
VVLPLEIQTLYRKEIRVGDFRVKKFLMVSILVFALAPQAWGQDSKGKAPVVPPKAPQYMSSQDDVPKTLPKDQTTTSSSGGSASAPAAPNANLVGEGVISAANYTPLGQKCAAAYQNVNTICIGNKNPGIQNAATLIASIGTAGLSMTETCSKFNDALKVANDAIVAYNAACSAAGYYCENTCGSAESSDFKTAQSATPASAPLNQAVNAERYLQGACKSSMTANLKDAAIGLAGMVASSALGKQCQDKTKDDDGSVPCTTTTAANGSVTNPLCINGIDCSLTANANNPTCICNTNPNSPGCPGATSYGSGSTSVTYGSTGSTTDGSMSVTSGTGGTGSGLSAVTRDSTSPASADGASVGSGGGGAVSGDSIAQSADAKKKGGTADKKGLSTNILSDYDGGGGGGRSGGGYGAAGGSAYNAYMPGQKKDPTRALASQSGAGQVTSAGSKSNWEKISERYMENKSTLMGD